jgi:hypothetical protein
MLFKNPVRTSKKTPHFTITKINWLTLFKFKYKQKCERAVKRVTKEMKRGRVTKMSDEEIKCNEQQLYIDLDIQ